MVFGLSSASFEKKTCGTCKPLALLIPLPCCCLQWRILFWELWAGGMKRNGLFSTLWDYVECLAPGHKFTWPLLKGEQVLFFFFSENLLEFMCNRNLLQAGYLFIFFLSFFCICVWKTVEYFNQYSYRNWRGLILSDSRNSLSGQIWWWICVYMHSGEGASASSLAWLGAWLQTGGLQTNLITSGFAWNWFPCKDAELLCASLMPFLSSLSLFFLFSLLLAMKTPRQMSIIFQVSVVFAELKGCSLRSGGGCLPGTEIILLFESTQNKSLYWTSQGLDCKVFAKRRAS